jgi:hypothetical protein
MGDASDDLITGICCEQCGEVIDGDAPGYTRLCSRCGGAPSGKSRGNITMANPPAGSPEFVEIRSTPSAMRHTESCRSCGALIVWATTEAGRKQPFDAKIESKAVLSVARDGTVHSKIVQVATPHHATCPNADQHRRSKR